MRPTYSTLTRFGSALLVGALVLQAPVAGAEPVDPAGALADVADTVANALPQTTARNTDTTMPVTEEASGPLTGPTPTTTNPAGCHLWEWDASAQWCAIYSPSMDKTINTIIRPAHSSSRVVHFFDGMDIFNDVNGWIANGHTLDNLRDIDATLVFPAGDSRTYYKDWDTPAPDGKGMKYETFYTQELPDFLTREFGVPNGGYGNTGAAGLSMGAYGAMNLAAKHPDLYRSVLALSGFYNPASPAEWVIDVPVLAGHQATPWPTPMDRAVDSPLLHLDQLDMPVIVAAASGLANLTGDLGPDSGATILRGGPLETGSFVLTAGFDVAARMAGKTNIVVHYDPIGAHTWDTWNRACWDRGLMVQFINNLPS